MNLKFGWIPFSCFSFWVLSAVGVKKKKKKKRGPLGLKHTQNVFLTRGVSVFSDRYSLHVSIDLCRAKQFGFVLVSRNWSVGMSQNQFVLFVPLQQNSRQRGCTVPSADLSIGANVGVPHISHHDKRCRQAPYLQTRASAQDGGRPRTARPSVRLSAEEKSGVYAHFCVCVGVCVTRKQEQMCLTAKVRLTSSEAWCWILSSLGVISVSWFVKFTDNT